MTEEATKPVRFSDPEIMRALAHPARLAVVEYLSREDEATATECAKVVGLSPSAMSYHLRALAKAGFVEHAPSRGDGRERVWRRKVRNWAIGPTYDAPESDRLAGRALAETFRNYENELQDRWEEVVFDQPQEWFEAASSMTANLHLTAAELKDLMEKIFELVAPYGSRRRREAGEMPDDARPVFLVARSIPIV